MKTSELNLVEVYDFLQDMGIVNFAFTGRITFLEWGMSDKEFHDIDIVTLEPTEITKVNQESGGGYIAEMKQGDFSIDCYTVNPTEFSNHKLKIVEGRWMKFLHPQYAIEAKKNYIKSYNSIITGLEKRLEKDVSFTKEYFLLNINKIKLLKEKHYKDILEFQKKFL